MKRCIVSTTCGYPDGECAGLCLHRLIRPVEQRMAIEYAGPEPEDKPESLWSRVWSAYKAHRALGRIRALRIAASRAWRN